MVAPSETEVDCILRYAQLFFGNCGPKKPLLGHYAVAPPRALHPPWQGEEEEHFCPFYIRPHTTLLYFHGGIHTQPITLLFPHSPPPPPTTD